jgi:MFS family permease
MRELYAVWTWIAAFVTASVYSGERTASAAGSTLAFLTIASGAIGSAVAGLFADRIGKARVAATAMIVSGACCLVAGLTFAGPGLLLGLLAVVWGIAVVADSAQLSALVAEHSPRDHVGTALTMQTCTGFLLTMLSIRLVPVVAHAIGWQWAFLCLAPGPFIGAFALRGLKHS